MILPSCSDEEKTQIFHPCSKLIQVSYEPVGRWFDACLKRQRSEKSVSFVEELCEKESGSDEDDKELTDEEKSFMLSLDATEWKKQDHYRVLGVCHLRWKATDEEIKSAYRKKVLKYHPDKKGKHSKKHLPPGLSEHDYFTCITRAYETLATLEGRQAYDSVDPTVDDTIPSYSPKQDFYKIFLQVFKNNSRWSKEWPVPEMGGPDTPQKEVNEFYSFWYDFKSWRNFAYMDEEEQADNREERRWLERENRRMRQKRKKDEIQRVRNIVELAYQNDPRIKLFKNAEKQKKLELKQAKEQAAQEKEKQRLEELEREKKLKEEEELEAKEKATREKKEKEKLRKAAARDRKVVRQAIKNENFFNIDENEITSLERLEQSLENLSLTNLQELRETVEKGDKDTLKELYVKHSTEVLEKLKEQMKEQKKKEEAALAAATKQSTTAQVTVDQNWTDTELQLLVKATTLFPVGTASRWEVIANYINEHSAAPKQKTAKQVINKVKNLKKLDPSLKTEVNKMAFKNLEKATSAKLTQNISSDISLKDHTGKATTPEDAPWTADEQKLLEQALKTYGSNTPERWDKVASLIPSRTKKECMRRYKELVEMIKAKKAAQIAASK